MIKTHQTLCKYQWDVHDMKWDVHDFLHQRYWWMNSQDWAPSGMIRELDLNQKFCIEEMKWDIEIHCCNRSRSKSQMAG